MSDKNWIIKQNERDDLNRLIQGNVIIREKPPFDKSKICKTKGKCLWKIEVDGEKICCIPDGNVCEFKEVRT